MSLAASDYTTRIGNELRLLGIPTAARVDIIKDALTELMLYLRDLLRISATLSVSSATKVYDIPATIDIIETIEDENGKAVVYSVDELEREITLQNSESSSSAVNYTVYGTPYGIRTNYDTIIGSMSESYGTALWDYVVWRCHKQASDKGAKEKKVDALESAHNLCMYLNSTPGLRDRTISIRDFRGKRIGTTGAHDGIDYNITEFAKTADYDPT